MKKFTFILMMMLAYSGFTMAQTIEDFESIKMNLFSQGANGALAVIQNPDSSEANPSLYVAKMVRGFDGDPWAGWYATIPTAIDITANPYVHVKVWKPRVSPTCFKVEGGAGNSGDVFPITEAAAINEWVEVVFDMSATAATGEYVKIVLIPDFLTPVGLTEDITLYFDDMYVNNDPTVGSEPVQIIENFETIPMTRLSGGGADDATSFVMIENPDASGINLSSMVLDFTRDMNAVPWTGFWASVTNVDVTTNKYVHVKLWKPRISGVSFKLEGGAAGTLEIASMNAQTKINAWEDFVFDFSGKTGTYPIIALLVDQSEEPLTEDSHIYIDDILVNNDPNPAAPAEQMFSVDMNGAGIIEGDRVFIAGALGGAYGTWSEPGTNPACEMFDTDGDGIYTIYMNLPDGIVAFKFFKNIGWGGGEPVAADRTYTVAGNANLIFTWGADGFVVSARDAKLAGKIQMYPNPVRNELTINTTSDIRKVIITNTLGKVVGNVAYNSNKTINTSTLSKGLYFVTFVGADGNKVTQKLIKD